MRNERAARPLLRPPPNPRVSPIREVRPIAQAKDQKTHHHHLCGCRRDSRHRDSPGDPKARAARRHDGHGIFRHRILSRRSHHGQPPHALVQTLPLTGSLRAVTQAAVKSKVAGSVLEVGVREGDAVQSGQILAKIDARDFAARAE
ncbi:biotin/lipoyl-binding protein [Paraburkholderia kirstenboschensis]|uniref:biotin/lipoyl-binding protein n=1 Tax=Paraburkholderia kirstenboschensis TaxID=1245436 RepID=UPI000AA5FDCB|nr:biotin/lipoyl-binding protein [Paraburkholderia kirstenboschensis]